VRFILFTSFHRDRNIACCLGLFIKLTKFNRELQIVSISLVKKKKKEGHLTAKGSNSLIVYNAKKKKKKKKKGKIYCF
jgi:hypothetical protein